MKKVRIQSPQPFHFCEFFIPPSNWSCTPYFLDSKIQEKKWILYAFTHLKDRIQNISTVEEKCRG